MIARFSFFTLFLACLTSLCAAQMVYTVPPDLFPTQEELDTNPESTINILFLNEINNKSTVANLNGATVNVQGDWIPSKDGSVYSNGTFIVSGRIGGSSGCCHTVIDSDVILEDGGLIDFDTELRGLSLMSITGGTFLEDFWAYDQSRLVIHSGSFYPDGASHYFEDSSLEILGGSVNGELSGHDNATGVISGGSISTYTVTGFSEMTIQGGEWPVSIFDNDSVTFDVGLLSIEGSCFAIEGIRLATTTGVPVSYSSSEISGNPVYIVLPNDTSLIANILKSPGTVVFIPTGDPCLADLNCSNDLNFFDVSIFLEQYLLNNSIADLNKDGEFNFFDVSAFLIAFAEGCP